MPGTVPSIENKKVDKMHEAHPAITAVNRGFWGVPGVLSKASHPDCLVDSGTETRNSKFVFVFQMIYTEDSEQQRGKGSFPAMITPAYQIAKRANELASDVSVPSNGVLLGEKTGSYLGLISPTSCLLLHVLWIQEVAFLHGCPSTSLPSGTLCPSTLPGPKKNIPQPFRFTLLASVQRRLNLPGLSFPFKQVRYHQQYQREMKGMAGSAMTAEGTLARDYVDQCGQVCDKMTF